MLQKYNIYIYICIVLGQLLKRKCCRVSKILHVLALQNLFTCNYSTSRYCNVVYLLIEWTFNTSLQVKKYVISFTNNIGFYSDIAFLIPHRHGLYFVLLLIRMAAHTTSTTYQKTNRLDFSLGRELVLYIRYPCHCLSSIFQISITILGCKSLQ